MRRKDGTHGDLSSIISSVYILGTPCKTHYGATGLYAPPTNRTTDYPKEYYVPKKIDCPDLSGFATAGSIVGPDGILGPGGTVGPNGAIVGPEGPKPDVKFIFTDEKFWWRNQKFFWCSIQTLNKIQFKIDCLQQLDKHESAIANLTAIINNLGDYNIDCFLYISLIFRLGQRYRIVFT